MRICDLNTGMAQLAHAFSELTERWNATKTQWQDDNCRQFEQTHLREIPARLQQTVAAIQRLSEVVDKAQRECDDRADVG